MSIKCGACGDRHETIAEIRECSAVQPVSGGQVETYLRQEAAYAEGQRVAEDIRAVAVATRYGYDRPVTGSLASRKQVKFLRDLLAQKEISGLDRAWVEALVPTLGQPATPTTPEVPWTIGGRTASYAIGQLVNLPNRPKTPVVQRASEPAIAPVAAVNEVGMYRNPTTGDIFKVYRTVHGANQLVAKRLVVLDESERYTKTVRGKVVDVRAEFVYEGKRGLDGLTADMRMSLEEGMKYGSLYGVCVRCSATLTREESIDRAMGPVCAGKENWAA